MNDNDNQVGATPETGPPEKMPMATTAPQQTVPQSDQAATSLNEVQNTTQQPASPGNEKKKMPLAGKIVLGTLIFLLLLASTLTYLIAYEKVILKNYPELQTRIASFVMSIPFTPKTPRYVLTQAAIAQGNIKSGSFDVSIAADSDGASLAGLPTELSLGGFDFQLTGDVDASDIENPKLRMNASITKDINADFIFIAPTAYFRVNKIDGSIKGLITTLLQGNFGFVGNWYHFDTTPLETPARENIEKKKPENPTEEYSLSALKLLTEEDVLQNLKMERSTFDGIPVYKLSIVLTDKFVDMIPEIISNRDNVTTDTSIKYSDFFKNVSIIAQIDQKEFYVRRVDTTLDVVRQAPSYTPPPGSVPTQGLFPSTGTVKVSLSSINSNFNESFDITAPEGSEDYTKLFEFFGQGPQPAMEYDTVQLEL